MPDNTPASHEQRRANPADDVPIKTILTTIGLVVATYLTWLVVKQVANILQLIVVAVFFALALNPAVDFLQRRARMHRAMATSVVFFMGVALVVALLYLFIKPLVTQTQQFVDDFPRLVEDARQGRGAIGELVQRYELDRHVVENQERLRVALTDSTSTVASVARSVASTIVSLLTVMVLSFLVLLEGRQIIRLLLMFFKPDMQRRITKIAGEGAHAVTGYVTGNLLISVIAGTVTFLTLTLTGVPFAVVLGVWVAFADLIPLVGATLGAIPTIAVAFLHSPEAGIISVIVYVVYQQIENHILQPTIMAKTVRLSPLAVLISVLLGVQLAGLLGALFAIPIAGVVQVVGRDLLEQRSKTDQPDQASQQGEEMNEAGHGD